MALGVARPTRLRTGPYVVATELLEAGTPGPLWVGTAHDGLRQGEPLLVRRVAARSDAQSSLRASGRWATELEHAGLLPMVDVRTAGDEVLLFSAFAEEVPLEEVLRLAAVGRRPIPPAIVARILIDLCEVGTYLHDLRRQGEVVLAAYRPDLVWIDRKGRARLLEPTVQDLVTRTEPWSQDPKRARYDAPERFEGVYAHPSDIWSLGVLAWEMLRNRPLFVGSDYATVRKRVATVEVRRADAFTPSGGVPIEAAFADAIETCLARRPSERFDDLTTLAEALQALDPAPREGVRELVDDLCEEVLVRYRRKVDVAIPGYPLAPPSSKPPAHPPSQPPSDRPEPSLRRRQILPSSRPPRRTSAPPAGAEDVEEVRIAPLTAPIIDVAITEKLPVSPSPRVDANAIEVVMPVEVGSEDEANDEVERRIKVAVAPPPPPSSTVGTGLPEAWDDDEAPEVIDEGPDSESAPPPLSVPPPPPKTGVSPAMWVLAAAVVAVVGGALWYGGRGGGPSPVPASTTEPLVAAPPPPTPSATAPAATSATTTESMDEEPAEGHDGGAAPEASSASPEPKPPPLPPRRPQRPRPRPKYIPGGI